MEYEDGFVFTAAAPKRRKKRRAEGDAAAAAGDAARAEKLRAVAEIDEYRADAGAAARRG